MKLKLILFIFGLILLVSSVSATTMVQNYTNYIGRWETNPCIDRNIEVNAIFNLKVYGIECKFFDDVSATCHNTQIKAVAYMGDTNAMDSGWQNVSAPQEANYFWWDTWQWWNQGYPIWINQQGTLDLASVYDKFAVRLSCSTSGCIGTHFAFHPNETSGSAGIRNYGNFTFTMNKTGSYVIRMYVRSQSFPEYPLVTQDINFTVSSSGVSYDDCISDSGAGLGGFSPHSNPFTNLPYIEFFWILFMIIVAAVIIIATKFHLMGIGGAILMSFLLLFVGTYFHIIDVVTLLVISVILAAIGAIVMKQVFA